MEIKFSTIKRDLFGHKFQFITGDPITWLFSITDTESRLARWLFKLEEYNNEIIYKPGNADALCRIKVNHCNNIIICHITKIKTQTKLTITIPFGKYLKSLLNDTKLLL